MTNEIIKTQDSITGVLDNMSQWMDSCTRNDMTLKEFLEKFNKFTNERKEGLEREREEDNVTIKSN